MAAGQRRRKLRDRAAALVPALVRSRAIQGPRRGGARLCRFLSHAAGRVSARDPQCRVRAAHQGGVPHPPRSLRPAVHRLEHAGEIPAHARGAAPDGGGDSRPVGKGRPQSADPAGLYRHRRPARAIRTDALPLGQLGAGDREGCRWTELAADEAGQRTAQPGQVLGLSPRGAGDLPGLGPDHGRRA